MGQYHYVVNLDKKQYLHPHRFGDGLKLLEFGQSRDGTLEALTLLLAAQAGQGGRGGGDPRIDAEGVIGSWAGDRIVIAGDYAEPGDPQGWDHEHGTSLYNSCDEHYVEISAAVLPLLGQ